MRKKVSGFVTVRAISGTYVVFLAFDMKEADAKGLMGFAIQRRDLTENETNWLRGSNLITLTSAANFSEVSVNTNDKNMVLIRRDKRVADIYFGEFMRVFAHHRFRESVKKHIEEFGSAAFNTWKPQDLFEDWKKWVPVQFRVGPEHEIKRGYFVG